VAFQKFIATYGGADAERFVPDFMTIGPVVFEKTQQT